MNRDSLIALKSFAELLTPSVTTIRNALSKLDNLWESEKKPRIIFDTYAEADATLELVRVVWKNIDYQLTPIVKDDCVDITDFLIWWFDTFYASKHALPYINFMWESENYSIVKTNKKALQDIFDILFNNALDHCENKEITIIVTEIDKTLRVIFRDYGIGIDDNEKEKIFNIFYKVASKNSPKSRHGVGLNTAKVICDILGYRLSIFDTEKRGATFEVEIPLVM